ncbi:MAG: entry exclusion lipoprotein TrbK [Azoarcus sp.]|jgi:entry exclusion lipoprotein TrbK|nr:entry exclusion lipoprotein TrbK [Azoarcus sp.]
MKKCFIKLSSLAIASLFLAGCNNASEPEINKENCTNKEFISSITPQEKQILFKKNCYKIILESLHDVPPDEPSNPISWSVSK